MTYDKQMFPLLNLLAVSMAWWAPGFLHRTGKTLKASVMRRGCVSGIASCSQGRIAEAELDVWVPEESKLAVTFPFTIRKPRCLIRGSVDQTHLMWGTKQLIFAGWGKWQMLACSLAASTTEHSSPCSQVLLRDTLSHITGPPTGDKSNLSDTKGKKNKIRKK